MGLCRPYWFSFICINVVTSPKCLACPCFKRTNVPVELDEENFSIKRYNNKISKFLLCDFTFLFFQSTIHYVPYRRKGWCNNTWDTDTNHGENHRLCVPSKVWYGPEEYLWTPNRCRLCWNDGFGSTMCGIYGEHVVSNQLCGNNAICKVNSGTTTERWNAGQLKPDIFF